MRSNILSLAAFAFAGLFATVQAEVWWTLYFDEKGGLFFLKDTGKGLETVSMSRHVFPLSAFSSPELTPLANSTYHTIGLSNSGQQCLFVSTYMRSSIFSIGDVTDSKDKGFRWAFKDGKLESQLNEGKFVGFDDEMQVWRTTYAPNDSNNLAAAQIKDMVATACRKTECVGSAGQRSDSYGWKVANVPYVQGS